MYREIIKPLNEEYWLHIPREYIGTEVEILVLPFQLPSQKNEQSPVLDGNILNQARDLLNLINKDNMKNKIQSLGGSIKINKEELNITIESIRDEWDRKIVWIIFFLILIF